jgi:hypothetical protein
MEPVQLAAVLVSAALLASLVSVQVGVSICVASLLVTIVVLSAIVPTAIAQRWFSPSLDELGEQPHHVLPPEPSKIPIGEAQS